MAKDVKRFILFKDGRKKEIIDENGKYWICKKGQQFRKLSPDIAEIVEEEQESKKRQKKKETVTPNDGCADSDFCNIPDLDDIPDVSDIVKD